MCIDSFLRVCQLHKGFFAKENLQWFWKVAPSTANNYSAPSEMDGGENPHHHPLPPPPESGHVILWIVHCDSGRTNTPTQQHSNDADDQFLMSFCRSFCFHITRPSASKSHRSAPEKESAPTILYHHLRILKLEEVAKNVMDTTFLKVANQSKKDSVAVQR